MNEILESSGVSKRYSILTETVSHMASTQVENIGTIEGNVCNTVPSAETVPPVIFLGDQMKLIGSRKERMVLAEGFLKDPDRTVTDNFELVRKIQLPPPLSGGREIYLKHTLRGQMDLPIGKVPACMAVWGSATKIWADLTILFKGHCRRANSSFKQRQYLSVYDSCVIGFPLQIDHLLYK